jgi:NHL repeat
MIPGCSQVVAIVQWFHVVNNRSPKQDLCFSGPRGREGGGVWVFHRGARIWDASSYDNGGSGERITFADPIQGNTILNLDADTGKLLGGFGSDFFYMPHGIAMDRESNIWVTDVGLHQVSVPISHVLPTGPVLFWLIRC